MTTSHTIWRIWCNDEQTFKLTVGVDAPTICPNPDGGSSHSVNLASVRQEPNSEDTVKIDQIDHDDDIPVGGYFRYTTASYDALPAIEDPQNPGTYLPTTTKAQFTYPYNISVITLGRVTGANEFGNVHSMHVVPAQTVIGGLTAPVAVGDTTWNVSPTVAAVAISKIGMYVYLADATNTDVAVNVLAADTTANTITVARAAIYAFAAGTPVYVPGDVPGATVATVAIGDTTISVSDTVFTLGKLYIGLHLNLYDGVNNHDFGDILAFDSVASTITLLRPSAHVYAAGTPVHLSNCPVFEAEIGHPWYRDPGASNIGSTKVARGNSIRPTYINKKTETIRIITDIQVFY